MDDELREYLDVAVELVVVVGKGRAVDEGALGTTDAVEKEAAATAAEKRGMKCEQGCALVL